MRFTSAEFHDGDRVGRSVKLCVGQVFEKATLGAAAWIARVDGRLGMTVLQVLADDGRVVERELAVHERRDLCARVHMQEVCPIAVAVQGSDPLEGHALLVQGDPYLPGVGAEHVVVEREHVARPSTLGRMNPEDTGDVVLRR